MAITERKKNQLANLNLSPKLFRITAIVNNNDELAYMKTQLEDVNEIRENNTKLAMKLKELREKYQQEKKEHSNTKKKMYEYYQVDMSCNIYGMYCPNLKKEIKLEVCNTSCANGYCVDGYNSCYTRINHIITHFKIPTE